jgi:DNA polymerase III delta subunit
MSVFLVSGDNEFLCRRLIRDLEKQALGNGWCLDWIDGDDPHSLRTSLQGASSLFQESGTLSVALTKGKLDSDVVLRFHERTKGKGESALVVYHRGKPSAKSEFAKLQKKLGGQHRSYLRPPPYKADEEALTFFIEEAKRYDLVLPPPLGKALIERMGSDMGLLSFEMLKISSYMKRLFPEDTEIAPAHVRRVVSNTSDNIFSFVNALGRKDEKNVFKSLGRIQGLKTPLMTVLLASWPTVLLWYQAAQMTGLRGLSPDKGADTLGINKWRYKNIILPVGQRWGTSSLQNLVSHYSSSEAGILEGNVDVWTQFEVGLLKIFQPDSVGL